MANNKLKGALELNWINKDRSLLYEIDENEGRGIKPVWVDKDDIRVSEPRNLKLVEEYGSPDNENMLIKGDNLLALRSLVEMFKNRDEKDKVKCIYIDPPFNTGNAFENYDDNLEHSQWLTMMRDRLHQLKKLLAKRGFIFVHIDEREVAYLKILMDEIFGLSNFQTMITWQRAPQRTVLGQGQTAIITIAEYILCYSRNFTQGKLKHIKKQYKATDKIMSQYRLTLTLGGEELVEQFQNGENNSPVSIYKYSYYQANTLPTRTSKSEYITRFSEFYQSVGIHEEHSFMQRILERLHDDVLYRIEYVPTRGKSAGKVVSSYILNRRKLLPAHEYASIGSDGEIYRTVDMNNIWLDDEINVTGIAKEGGVNLRRGKKPEALIKRIIELSTDLGDLVLDSFLGSGTTVAVARKMDRRWIGIEIGEHAETLVIPRLKRVITAGEDRTGISKVVNWKGGGGFRYYIVGESLILESDMNWDLTYEEIAKALFMMFDYTFVGGLDDEIYIGKRKEKYALSIASKAVAIIKSKELDDIVTKVKETYNNVAELEIYTNKGVGVKEGDLPAGLAIKKIPESVLRKYKL